MARSTYTPPAGSKAAQVADAMRIVGPLTITQIADAIGVPEKEATEILALPLDREFFIKVQGITGGAYYALRGMELDKNFIVCPSFANAEVADSPVVRRVTKPSVNPSPTAIAFAHPFSWKTPAASEEPLQEEAARPEEIATVADATKAPAAPEFLAGLFSNGDLVIKLGDESLKLGPRHARQLADYLNRIDAAIVK